MAYQELTKQELSDLMAGAKAINAIVDRVAKEWPEEIPQDVIRQWEIAVLYHAEFSIDALALGFRRRLEAGATIEPGSYILEPDHLSMEDLEDKVKDPYPSHGFSCTGFDTVDFKPAKGVDRD
jgi:hypothetical protein